MPSLMLHQTPASFFTQIPKQLRTSYLLSLLCVSITALMALVMYTSFPPEIPLFYSLSAPDQHIVAKVWILIVPVFALAMLVINTAMIRLNSSFELVITQIMTWTTTALLGLSCLVLIRIWLVLTL